MLLGNFSIVNKNPGREVGLAGTNPYSGWKDSSPRAIFNLAESNVQDVTNRMSMPAGYRDEYQWLLAPKAGGMSTSQIDGDGDITTALGQNGLAATATLAGIGVISNAAAGLIVEMLATIAGSSSLTASIVGQLQAAATLAGSGSVSAAISAISGMVATLTGSGLISDAQQEALGQMVADIYVNQSQATVDQIVEGVTDSLGSITATVPNLLNTETGDIIIPLG